MTIFSRFALLAGLSLASICSTAVPQSPPPSNTLPSGPELRLDRDDRLTSKDGMPGFRITLGNAGHMDLVLNIGMLLSNGHRQYPSAIKLLLTDPKGKTWEFSAGEPMSIGGRLDPFVLALPTGATFTLPLKLEDDVSFRLATADARLAGPCTLKARFAGKGVPFDQANLDYKGVSLMPYWVGTVESNEVRFEAPEKK